jgi:hypothetical protein
MDRQGLSRIRRAELLARLSALDALIDEQTERTERIRDMGWDAAVSEEKLKLLAESRRLYTSALKHLLGDDFLDRAGEDGER